MRLLPTSAKATGISEARMCLTFQMMTLEKYLTKNFEIFFRGGGTPFLALKVRRLKKLPPQPGWDETNFLGRDRDREIRLMKIHYETKKSGC